MITIFFDIDGTLMLTGGSGMKAIGQAMNEMFGVTEIPKVKVHGRTDQGILNDLFSSQALPFDEHRETFSRRYWELLPNTMQNGTGYLLPGVKQLLDDLQERANVALGILTGNAKRAAEIKLQHFELETYFDFGGYGDRDECRNDVARQAYQSAESHLQESFNPDQLWVVGDTLADIHCARAIGSKVVAVATGGCGVDELASARPDVVLESLEETGQFLSHVLD